MVGAWILDRAQGAPLVGFRMGRQMAGFQKSWLAWAGTGGPPDLWHIDIDEVAGETLNLRTVKLAEVYGQLCRRRLGCSPHPGKTAEQRAEAVGRITAALAADHGVNLIAWTSCRDVHNVTSDPNL